VLLLMAFTISAEGADQYPELPRFDQISERLYRGGQPRSGGIRRLSELGINTIINLRGTDANTRSDEAEARSLGLNYFNIPLPIWGRPNDARVRRILEIVNAPESGRVFVHCRDGIDRTGMIVALYRVQSEGWSTEKATAEAMRCGMRRHQYWMRDYIDDFYVRQQRAGEGDIDELKDKIGAGVRIGERVVFGARKTAVRAARKAPRAVSGFLANVF
jgi:tyrosine-protein phosphatase SIW14